MPLSEWYAAAEQNANNDAYWGIRNPELMDEGGDDDSDDDSLGSWGAPFDPYEELQNEDFEDLEDMRLILNKSKMARRIKFQHRRIDWDYHREMLENTNEFENRFRMKPHHFDTLLEALREPLTVCVKHSLSSTRGNEPISPEVILACGLRFCGMGENPGSLADIYGISNSSAKRAVRMFLDAVDYNSSYPELQVVLPDPTNEDELFELAQRWQDCSTSMGLFKGFLGPMDGWLPRTEAPKDVHNQGDYFSGHYQCYGLNCQALCDPDLLFMYFCIAAPGKTNDARAFDRCVGLKEWLARLPPEFFTCGDNAYILTRKLLTPYTTAEIGGDALKRTYNYFLSQLRIRIEMAFGRLTTKWRRLRSTLNFHNSKNAQIIRVCTKLHNFCIRMKKADGDDVTPRVTGDERSVNPSDFGIDPLNDGGNRQSSFGYLETVDDEEDDPVDYARLVPPDGSRRTRILTEVYGRQMMRPRHNRERNRRGGELEEDDEEDEERF